MNGERSVLQALNIPGEVFRNGQFGVSPCNTSQCPNSKSTFASTELFIKRTKYFQKRNGIEVSDEEIDRYRCDPPETKLYNKDGNLKQQLMFFYSISSSLFHAPEHVKSCFKKSPFLKTKGLVCRFRVPTKSCNKSDIDELSGDLTLERAIGFEYYNVNAFMWTRLLKDNSDFKFIINGASRKKTAYTRKYSFIPQTPESALIMEKELRGSNGGI